MAAIKSGTSRGNIKVDSGSHEASGKGSALAAEFAAKLASGGSGTTTLFGGSDPLGARGFSKAMLVTGAGNETLTGAVNTANNPYYAQAGGNVLLQGGNGADTFVIGASNTTVGGGPGRDLISIVAGGRGTVTVRSLNAAERITLQGYASGEANRALAAAAGSGAPGSLVLSDGTKVNFLGATQFDARGFI